MHSRTNVVSAVAAVTVQLANVVASAAASVVKAVVARVAKVLPQQVLVQVASAVSAVKAVVRAVMTPPRRAVVLTTTRKRVSAETLL
jgi:hypothetical protein